METPTEKKPTLVRLTTVDQSMNVLLKGQLRFMSQHYRVVVISAKGPLLDEVKIRENVEVWPLYMTRKITPIQDLIGILRLTMMLRKIKPDIVHSHTPKAGLIGMTSAWLARVPNRLHTVAGLPLETCYGLKKKILIHVEKITYRLATHVLPNSFGLKSFIVSKKLCPDSKTTVIAHGSSNGIDTAYFSKMHFESGDTKKAILSKWEIPKNAVVFTFIGRIVTDKGINELVQAFSELKHPNAYLILVGEYEPELDPIHPETQRLIRQTPTIVEVGYQKDVRPYLDISDVFVFPSYREGFPNVVLQALAMQVPCIVSNINGCNELIENHQNGLIVPIKNADALRDAMNRLYQDAALREKLGKESRKSVEKFEQKHVWNELLRFYRNITKSKKS